MCYTVFLETNRGAKYMKLTHKHTLAASYLGYITQAVVNNLTPLLFVVFETSLGISIGRISLLHYREFRRARCWWIFYPQNGSMSSDAAGHRCRPRLCRGRACGAGRSAVPDSGPICGRAVCGLPVRGGRRHYRGAHQSHRGGAAQRRQGRLDEPAARILLLGPCGGGGAVNPVFRVGGHRTLGAAACAVGRAAAVQHGAVRAGAAVHAGGRRAPHAAARTAEKAK